MVERTCSVEGCHPADVHKVKNSLMATNRGILATLLYYWGEREDQHADISVEQLLKTGETSLAIDYFRKLCATCHLWKQKNDLPGAPAFFNEKGGGCSACHYVLPPGVPRSTVTRDVPPPATEEERKNRPHPLVVKQVPEDNCIRCHNRSGRIGISYVGLFEAEGYGTPYEQGDMSSQQLAGGRFYLKIAEDIHHTKKMACIDCHTRDEIMGDGTNYAHYEEQLEITCQSCHDVKPGLTRKGNRLTNVAAENGRFVLTGKIDGKKRELRPPKELACSASFHRRVTCAACHSTWVPQCYGCHVKRDKRETHLDKLTLQETPGWWEEGRSYIRYEKPMLAVWADEVVVVTPGCQDLVTLIDEKGEREGGFNRFTMAAINPHTIQAKGRDCKDCHASPKTVGLGEGTVVKKDGKWSFSPGGPWRAQRRGTDAGIRQLRDHRRHTAAARFAQGPAPVQRRGIAPDPARRPVPRLPPRRRRPGVPQLRPETALPGVHGTLARLSGFGRQVLQLTVFRLFYVALGGAETQKHLKSVHCSCHSPKSDSLLAAFACELSHRAVLHL